MREAGEAAGADAKARGEASAEPAGAVGAVAAGATGAAASDPAPAEGKSVLLISDLAGYGKVALAAMIPVLSSLRLNVYNLPTALVSNTLDYGKFDILETTGYMRNALAVWDELGFRFDAVFAGFLFSDEQSRLVADYCQRSREQGLPVFVDPIMGDWGSLYNGVTSDNVAHARKLCGVADVIMPNMTEAQFLCDRFIGQRAVTHAQAEELVAGLRALGARSVVITSMQVDGQPCTVVCEQGSSDLSLLPYDELPVQMPGTGDIFSSMLMGHMLNGFDLVESTQAAMDAVARLLERSLDVPDRFKGVPIELWLDEVRLAERR